MCDKGFFTSNNVSGQDCAQLDKAHKWYYGGVKDPVVMHVADLRHLKVGARGTCCHQDLHAPSKLSRLQLPPAEPFGSNSGGSMCGVGFYVSRNVSGRDCSHLKNAQKWYYQGMEDVHLSSAYHFGEIVAQGTCCHQDSQFLRSGSLYVRLPLSILFLIWSYLLARRSFVQQVIMVWGPSPIYVGTNV